MPVRPVAEDDEVDARPFGEPEGAEPIAVTRLTRPDQRWTVRRELVDYENALEIVKNTGLVRFEDLGLEVDREVEESYGWVADDFCSPRGETSWSVLFRRGEWSARTDTHTTVTCTPEEFVVHARLDAYEGDVRTFSRNWNRRIPRDCV
ncbi:hypothetical protein FPZ12_036295 [Amycolatopsis acidicola]|uniref:Uncharacterized protein n=1 Tax=Amycolatopsis acidicola TaxID=2596893 RepID=A0A5N0USQ3_9PSEU|nr:hypothetical protein [Amycolatopsis acidicola]KAA9152764.1 hypothetical protein FPZ12_036295 [Amycolatopsis acidicola]